MINLVPEIRTTYKIGEELVLFFFGKNMQNSFLIFRFILIKFRLIIVADNKFFVIL